MTWRIAHNLALCGLLALAACGYHPLYATDAGGRGVVAALESVAIPAAETRLDQIIRDDLLSGMRPAGSARADRYTLTFKTTTKETQVIDSTRPKPQRNSVSVAVTFTLAEGASQLLAGKTFAQVSYDEINQPFADQQARDNATERAAHEVSGDIRTRLAAYFSSHP